MIDIPKTHDPKEAERHHYARWEERGYFAPEINKDPNAPVFTIVIPPPNVTGSLHMGHALQHTMMDVMTRHRRMSGYRTLWLPGMDHASISTQLMKAYQPNSLQPSPLWHNQGSFLSQIVFPTSMRSKKFTGAIESGRKDPPMPSLRSTR